MKRSNVLESNPRLCQRDFTFPRQIQTPPTITQLVVESAGEAPTKNWSRDCGGEVEVLDELSELREETVPVPVPEPGLVVCTGAIAFVT
jgi:hypothetical protein